jgi:hypothetical protein
VVAPEQLPVPEQNVGRVWVDPLQELPPHWTVLDASWQVPAPSHAPVLPHGGLAAQRAWGSAAPDPTFAHVPTLPAMLQALQVRQLALEQQTPSTQLPVMHSVPAMQLAPGPFLETQLPPEPVQ